MSEHTVRVLLDRILIYAVYRVELQLKKPR